MTEFSGRYTLPLKPSKPQPRSRAPQTSPRAEHTVAADPSASVPTDQYSRKWLDVPYAKESPSEKLDLFLPDEGQGVFPLIIVVHSGGFYSGDKNGPDLQTVLDPALAKGYAVASVNYRLSGEATFPAAIEDVRAAIRFLRAHATSFQLNPVRFALWGFSAGGNLAALAGSVGRMSTFVNPTLGNPDTAGDVQAVVDFYGPIDFTMMDPQFVTSGVGGGGHDDTHSPESRYLGAPITAVPWLVQETNPQTYLSQGVPPFFILHGLMDTVVPYQQSVQLSFYLNLYQPASRIYLRLLENAGHGGEAFAASNILDEVFDFLSSFLNAQ